MLHDVELKVFMALVTTVDVAIDLLADKDKSTYLTPSLWPVIEGGQRQHVLIVEGEKETGKGPKLV